jgi:hypothetical protein
MVNDMTYKMSSPGPDVRFIRLGKSGAWAKRAIAAGEIPFGYRETSHELALAGDRTALVAHFCVRGQRSGDALQSANEVLMFYEAAPERIWVTAHAGRLWWAKADAEITWTGDASGGYGARLRRAQGGWRSTDINGRELRIDEMSSALTKMRRYRRTICAAPAELLNVIMAASDPLVDEVVAAKQRLEEGVGTLIAKLDEGDFELFVALALERAGWQRTSAIGGAQEEVDIVLEQPLTRERAGVQVKSSSTGVRLRDCAARLNARGYDRVILACHTLHGSPPTLEAGALMLGRPELATLACEGGLTDWLIEKARGVRRAP